MINGNTLPDLSVYKPHSYVEYKEHGEVAISGRFGLSPLKHFIVSLPETAARKRRPAMFKKRQLANSALLGSSAKNKEKIHKGRSRSKEELQSQVSNYIREITNAPASDNMDDDVLTLSSTAKNK